VPHAIGDALISLVVPAYARDPALDLVEQGDELASQTLPLARILAIILRCGRGICAAHVEFPAPVRSTAEREGGVLAIPLFGKHGKDRVKPCGRMQLPIYQ
jgi:hypothetical protein